MSLYDDIPPEDGAPAPSKPEQSSAGRTAAMIAGLVPPKPSPAKKTLFNPAALAAARRRAAVPSAPAKKKRAVAVASVASTTSSTVMDLTDRRSDRLTVDVEDPYDPAEPNDYISWCEERVARRKAMEAEKQLKRQLEEQEEQHRRLMDERQKLAGKVASGELSAVEAIASERPAGRGKINNMPAWMVQRKRQEEAKNVNDEEPE